LPKGKKLVTVHDAALYITKLPKTEHNAGEWQKPGFYADSKTKPLPTDP